MNPCLVVLPSYEHANNREHAVTQILVRMFLQQPSVVRNQLTFYQSLPKCSPLYERRR